MGDRLGIPRAIGFFILSLNFPDVSDSKESTCKAGDQGSIAGWGRPPGEIKLFYHVAVAITMLIPIIGQKVLNSLSFL